jgi:hypothetical protein
VFQLREDLLDGVQIGRVFGQEQQLGASRSDRSPNGFSFVAAEIVHHHKITSFEGWHEHPLDISREALAVDRAVENPWGVDAVMAQRRHKGHRLPMAVRNFGFEPLAPRRPAPERRHVGLGPGLIDEHQALGIDPGLILFPLLPPSRHVRTILFAGEHGFF